jgi:hypothetical protein
MIKTTHTMLGVALAASFLLAGCGPESTTATSATKTSSQASTSGPASGGDQGPGGSSDQREAIETCLKKAGLDDKLRKRGLSQKSSERPSGPPSGPDRQAGGPFADADVQKALKACGIDLPQPPSQPDQPS